MNIEDIKVNEEVRIVFMGTPDFAVPILEGLVENYKVKAVVTQPDKQVGRSGKIAKPPVKVVAEENNILVIQLDKLKEQYQDPSRGFELVEYANRFKFITKDNKEIIARNKKILIINN